MVRDVLSQDFAAPLGLSFTPDSRNVVAGFAAGQIASYSVPPGKKRERQIGRPASQSFALSPDGLTAAIAGSGGGVLWDLEANTQRAAIPAAADEVLAACTFSLDGRSLIVASDRRGVLLFQLGATSCTLVDQHPADAASFAGICPHPDGQTFAVSARTSKGAGVSFFQVKKDQLEAGVAPAISIPGHAIGRGAFTKDGTHFAVASRRFEVYAFPSGRGHFACNELGGILPFDAPEPTVDAGLFSQVVALGPARLAFGTSYGRIFIVDSRSGERLSDLEGHAGGVFSLASSSNGRWLASAGADRTLRLQSPPPDEPSTVTHSPKAERTGPRKKSSTLVIATRKPKTCDTCRHINQGTADFLESKLSCQIDGQTKKRGQTCDVSRPLPATSPVDIARADTWATYYYWERFTGDNGTYGRSEDLRVLAEDADPQLRAALRADEAFIPGQT